jgi:ATP-dependent protease ClpP protease subunit
MIERYNFRWWRKGLEGAIDGDFVRYEDHAAEVERLRSALESVLSVETTKSETEDGEIEWWLNDNQIRDIVDDALKQEEAE